MPRRPALVTQASIKKVLKGAAEAGLRVTRFEVDAASGRIIVISGETSIPDLSPLEAWRARNGQS